MEAINKKWSLILTRCDDDDDDDDDGRRYLVVILTPTHPFEMLQKFIVKLSLSVCPILDQPASAIIGIACWMDGASAVCMKQQ